jgi:hypothetical protein
MLRFEFVAVDSKYSCWGAFGNAMLIDEVFGAKTGEAVFLRHAVFGRILQEVTNDVHPLPVCGRQHPKPPQDVGVRFRKALPRRHPAHANAKTMHHTPT